MSSIEYRILFLMWMFIFILERKKTQKLHPGKGGIWDKSERKRDSGKAICREVKAGLHLKQ